MTRIWTIDNRMGGPMVDHRWTPFTRRDGSQACAKCDATPSEHPNTTEIVYTWPHGREEVRYRRQFVSVWAQVLESEVARMRERLGKECPYSVRHVHQSVS